MDNLLPRYSAFQIEMVVFLNVPKGDPIKIFVYRHHPGMEILIALQRAEA